MFAAPRSNNAVSHEPLNLKDLKFATTYSFAFTDQEADSTKKNNRLLALAGSYQAGPVGFYLGGTQIWYGKNDASGLVDKSMGIDRKDASAYNAGVTWAATDDLKLFLAGQYQKDWRSVAGWNVDKSSTYATSSYSVADRYHGIDGWVGLVGFQYKFSKDLRLSGKYVYFDGEHKMADGTKVDGQRHSVNAALEKKLSKRTKVYWVMSYFKGKGEMDVDTLTGVTGHLGLEHNF